MRPVLVQNLVDEGIALPRVVLGEQSLQLLIDIGAQQD